MEEDFLGAATLLDLVTLVLLTAAAEVTEALAMEEDFLGAATLLDSVLEELRWGVAL
jgi:hypothetical protein